MPSVHQATFLQGYQRYIGSLDVELSASRGMNASTHVAQVCMDPEAPTKGERAVVKHFQYFDKGWVNEFLAWTLAQELGVRTAPRAALLIGKPEDLTEDHGAELQSAVRLSPGPMVLWCTSAVHPTQPLQQVLGHSWEQAALRIESGKLMAALDGWTANCDRIVGNALFWVTQGALVAIDHEKMVFNQDWTSYPVPHEDEKLDADGKPLLKTRLIDVLMAAKKSKDKAVKKNASSAAQAMYEHSKTKHPLALSSCRSVISALVDDNFSHQATQNLLSFLDYRLTEDCLKRRYGFLL